MGSDTVMSVRFGIEDRDILEMLRYIKRSNGRSYSAIIKVGLRFWIHAKAGNGRKSQIARLRARAKVKQQEIFQLQSEIAELEEMDTPKNVIPRD